ncbi:MAG: hypothetical protein WC024_10740 [Shewanella sp.]|uniref:hypothetical protein n=1 Tax=unclassified Shewanella TaxID=196818 RepID=UPI0021D80778|nr:MULTISPECIES: hypothetical protein [unclassified Shewanella]MCU8034733.1 hypothetical protein [Shewanella sp. SM71]MCU8096602.1 hypothetical protein [Shewanella sp. SM102]
MFFYLALSLSSHRRGRFLGSLVDAEPVTETLLPHQGCVLMLGKDFQQLEIVDKKKWREWAQLSGRTLMLLPPYNSGLIDEDIDWQIGFSESVSSVDAPLVRLLESEITQQIAGRQGVSERSQGHLWGSSAVNTCYLKHHAASGVFAVTCLPLWSISLIDEAELVREWFAFFDRLAGTPDANESDAYNEPTQLVATDYSIMACIYAWQVISASELSAYLAKQVFPIFQFNSDELDAGFSRLLSAGYANECGLTTEGIQILKASAYWLYADQLKDATR